MNIINRIIEKTILLVEVILDFILDFLPYDYLSRFPLASSKLPHLVYFDYVINQKIQRACLIGKIKKSGVNNPVRLKTWWPRSRVSNFGDLLTNYILAGIAGIDCVYQRDMPFVAVGSVVRLVKDNSVVWGSGIIRKAETVTSKPNVLAVRGPLTRDVLLSRGIECPEAYGDPAMLIPLFYQPKKLSPKKILLAPHFKHDFLRAEFVDFDSINLRVNSISEMEQVIDAICAADCVLTSSLHVFIICTAYSVPVSVFQLNGVSIHGDNIKFDDFCIGVGIKPVKINYLDKLSKANIMKLSKECQCHQHNWDPRPLLEALYLYIPTPALKQTLSALAQEA